MPLKNNSQQSARGDPYLSFRFGVEIDGILSAGFNDVIGLTLETEVQTFREGGNNLAEQQLPGTTKYPAKLNLKRGLADAHDLWKWYEDVTNGLIERRDVSILLLDSKTNEERWRWVILEAYPVKWSGPEFRANSSEIAFESVELVHKGLRYAHNKKR